VIDIVVPDEQEGTKAVVRAWLKRVGDAVAEHDPLVEIETDKVTQEVAAPAAGVLAEILLDTDSEAEPGAVLGRIDDCAPAEAGAQTERGARVDGGEHEALRPTGPLSGSHQSTTLMDTLSQGDDQTETRLSPAVRQALQQYGLDTLNLTGTGRDGRITREDVDRAIAGTSSTNELPADRMRRTIAENMVRAVTEAPHVTAVFEADFSAVTSHKAAMADRGVKLSYTAYIVKASAKAMAAAPQINGRWEKGGVIVSPTIDIGVGTALGEKGLVVPVIRDAGSLSLDEIGQKLDELTAKAREGRLDRSEVSGGSFTISNHGVSGSLLAAPIILHNGQAAILGIGKLQKRVVVRQVGGEDTVVIRPMAYVTLTIDHRVVDAHQTNAWLTRFVEILESWPPA
jgi:2-oxoglutarate dehydrogenase E2 component (dihydrolipoamide succinyltransferase)